MTNNPNKGKGRAITFLREHAGHTSDECLIWPMFRLQNGYGHMGWNGKVHYPHRLMCEFAHGQQPSPDHVVAHSCGRGHDGCVNPRHLSWKTMSGNLLDAVAHGTHTGNRWTNRGRLKPEQVIEIRRLKGEKTQAEIAALFGITDSSVRDIYLGRTYRSVP